MSTRELHQRLKHNEVSDRKSLLRKRYVKYDAILLLENYCIIIDSMYQIWEILKKFLPKMIKLEVAQGVHLIMPPVLYFHEISPFSEFNAYIQ